MVELCATCALLATAIPLTVAALGAVAQQRSGVELRQRAIETADNLLERLSAEPWDRLSPDRLAEFALAAAAEQALPDGELKLALARFPRRPGPPGEPAAKRIDLELSWRASAARVRNRVRLSGWVFREAAP
ncbi:MAG TPA: hypothetical protein VMV10_21715 [Pirellulales bacterium]|nr:hypothetical protein [Pirellulales bacterium]